MFLRKKTNTSGSDNITVVPSDNTELKSKADRAKEALAKLDQQIEQAETSRQRNCCGCGC